MGDWPEFRLLTDDGHQSEWTREGDYRRYVEGLRVKVAYVEHEWKEGLTIDWHTEGPDQIVLQIWIEESPRRSSGFAPGPGNSGIRDARKRGRVVHYLQFPDRTNAEAIAGILRKRGLDVHVQQGETGTYWFVQI